MAQPTSPTASNRPPSMRPTPGISPGAGSPSGMAGTPGIEMANSIPANQIPVGSLSVTPEQGNRIGGNGVASQGIPQSPDTPPAEPFLFGDIDGVYLARLYPGTMASAQSAAADKAMQDGWDAYNRSMEIVSAQEEAQQEAAGEEGQQAERGQQPPQPPQAQQPPPQQPQRTAPPPAAVGAVWVPQGQQGQPPQQHPQQPPQYPQGQQGYQQPPQGAGQQGQQPPQQQQPQQPPYQQR